MVAVSNLKPLFMRPLALFVINVEQSRVKFGGEAQLIFAIAQQKCTDSLVSFLTRGTLCVMRKIIVFGSENRTRSLTAS